MARLLAQCWFWSYTLLSCFAFWFAVLALGGSSPDVRTHSLWWLLTAVLLFVIAGVGCYVIDRHPSHRR